MSIHRIGVWGLVMINLAALGGLRSWAPIAGCGLSSVFFLVAATLLFFLPLAIVSAELTTTWPQSGGVYGWVKEAFGHKWGFLAIWVLWIENVLYYPMILSFIVGTAAFVFDPSLMNNKTYTFIASVAIFWCVSGLNLKSFKAAAWFSSFGAVGGTFIPGILIIALGAIWFLHGNPMELDWSWQAAIPETSSGDQLSLFAAVIFSLFGIEMSAMHAGQVDQPRKSFPKAIFLSGVMEVFFSILGVLSIAMVVPKSDLAFSAGCLQAFQVFADAYHLSYVLQITALVVAIGAIGSMSTWILGPCIGMIAAARRDNLPAILMKKDGAGCPRNFLIAQAVIVSIICFLFLVMPSLNATYWIFLVLSTQLYLVMYLLLFGAAIYLRYKFPNVARPFQAPGGLVGMWVIGGVGFMTSFASLVISFMPPKEMGVENIFTYVAILTALLLLFISIPFVYSRRKRVVSGAVV